jgi:hypothetical protein
METRIKRLERQATGLGAAHNALVTRHRVLFQACKLMLGVLSQTNSRLPRLMVDLHDHVLETFEKEGAGVDAAASALEALDELEEFVLPSSGGWAHPDGG